MAGFRQIPSENGVGPKLFQYYFSLGNKLHLQAEEFLIILTKMYCGVLQKFSICIFLISRKLTNFSIFLKNLLDFQTLICEICKFYRKINNFYRKFVKFANFIQNLSNLLFLQTIIQICYLKKIVKFAIFIEILSNLLYL